MLYTINVYDIKISLLYEMMTLCLLVGKWGVDTNSPSIKWGVNTNSPSIKWGHSKVTVIKNMRAMRRQNTLTLSYTNPRTTLIRSRCFQWPSNKCNDSDFIKKVKCTSSWNEHHAIQERQIVNWWWYSLLFTTCSLQGTFLLDFPWLVCYLISQWIWFAWGWPKTSVCC